jgi:hypothetical protein
MKITPPSLLCKAFSELAQLDHKQDFATHNPQTPAWNSISPGAFP